MTGRRIGLRLGIAGALAMSLAACGGGPRPPKGTPPPAKAPPVDTFEAIIALLDRGEVKPARKRIGEALRRSPLDPNLLLLRDSIDRDPVELLGPKSYPYETQPGETIAGIAQRLLGNRLKAYQLARYNGITDPSALSPGTTLRIPGTASKPIAPPPPRRAAPGARPAPVSPRAKPAPAPAASARPVANPAAAARARRAGLAALNRGNAAQAVGLLRRAATLDPGNAVIARDLERAQRIARTVRSRR